MDFLSLQAYADAVFSQDTAITELDPNMAVNVEDDFFTTTLKKTRDSDEHAMYILSSAFLKLCVRNQRFELSRHILHTALHAISQSDFCEQYLSGIMLSAIQPATHRGDIDFVKKAIDLERKITNGQWVTLHHFQAAMQSTEEHRVSFTRLFARCQSFGVLGEALSIAAFHKAFWQVDVLVEEGADITSLKEKEIKSLFGAPRTALNNIKETQSHVLPHLFKRYIRASKSNPLGYLDKCPDWQKPLIMEVIASC